eukprot:3313915-Amphidinium_carterae.1
MQTIACGARAGVAVDGNWRATRLYTADPMSSNKNQGEEEVHIQGSWEISGAGCNANDKEHTGIHRHPYSRGKVTAFAEIRQVPAIWAALRCTRAV